MNHSTFNPFLIGCIGALAPEILRLYNLRLKPDFQWSWGYLIFSFPFILLGGFIAYILEPTTSYAAFYTGVSTPFIVTMLAKDSEREAKTIQRLSRDKELLEAELQNLQQSPSLSLDKTATVIPQPDLYHPRADGDNTASGHSALRSSSASSMVMPSALRRNSTIRYLPQSSSRHLSKWQIFQAFLKGL